MVQTALTLHSKITTMWNSEDVVEIFDVDMDVYTELEKKIKDTHGMKYISHDIFLRASAGMSEERNERCIDWRIKMLEVGTKAPDFELPDQNGELHKLSEYLGKKVILYFYPRDNTPGCTKQACGFSDRYPHVC